jgi:hypothetical protein
MSPGKTPAFCVAAIGLAETTLSGVQEMMSANNGIPP